MPTSMSKQIEATIAMLEQAKRDYTYSYDKVNTYDRETQDILHKLELERLSQNEKSKLATRLAKVRKERRRHKDLAEAARPLVEFLESEKGKQTYNLLREVLGQTRKVERYHETRTYKKRIMEESK